MSTTLQSLPPQVAAIEDAASAALAALGEDEERTGTDFTVNGREYHVQRGEDGEIEYWPTTL